jgi:hypothetical protein
MRSVPFGKRIKKVAFVSGAGEPSAEEKEKESDSLYASLPPPYATVNEDWGRRLQVKMSSLFIYHKKQCVYEKVERKRL